MSHIRTASKRRISYDESGIGPPVLLIPGHGGYRRGCLIWLAEALAPRFRFVAMDNRDAGESEPETEYYGLADMAGDAAVLLDGLGIDRAHVLGHSMGAAIALQLALDYPTRVDRLVLVSPAVGGSRGTGPVSRCRRPCVVGGRSRGTHAPRAARCRRAGLSLTDESGGGGNDRQLERGNRTTWAGMMRREAAAAGDDQILSRLAGIRTPTLVIHGDADVSVPLEQAQALAARIPGARFVVLPGVGHRPWVERPDVANGAILAFLSEAGDHVPAGEITEIAARIPHSWSR